MSVQDERTQALRLELMRVIDRHWSEWGHAPALEDIRAAMNYATVSAAKFRVDDLVACGWAQRRPGMARTIRLTDEGMSRLEQARD